MVIHAYCVCVYVCMCAVRQKAKEIIGFVQDEERLREARKQAKQTRDKYVGYSSEEATSRYSKLVHFIASSNKGLSLSLSLSFSFFLPSGDRYAPEPRSRSSKLSGWSSSHYDEDPRGPIGGEYHDEENTGENGYKDDAGDEHRTATQG